MLCSVSFESINPTIANTITELFFLPVQDMLQKIKQAELLQVMNVICGLGRRNKVCPPWADKDVPHHQKLS